MNFDFEDIIDELDRVTPTAEDTDIDDEVDDTPTPDTDPDTDPDTAVDTDPDLDPNVNPITEPTPEPTKVTTTDSDDIDPETLKGYHKFLSDYGLVVPEEGEEFDGTLASFEKALEKTQKVISETAYQNIWNALPDQFKPLLEYGLAGGNSLEAYINAYKPLDYNNADLSDPTTGRKILYDYYKSTSNYSDERIQKFIDTLSQSDTFEDDVQEALDELQQLQAQQQQDLLANVERQKLLDAERAQQQTETLLNTITTSEALQGIRKDRVKTFLLHPITTEAGESTTEFNQAISQVFSNPEHLVQLADILADYHPLRGFTFNNIKKKLKTEATKSVKTALSSALESQKSKGTTRTVIDDGDFDWKNVL